MPLLWRVFLGNAVVLAVATLLLVVTPATVSFPIALTEAVVLGAGRRRCWGSTSCCCGGRLGRWSGCVA